MSGELGKASLDLEANLGPFERNVHQAERSADELQGTLDALSAVAKISADALNKVKIAPGQAAESKASAEGILSGVKGISEESRTAAREIDKVKISAAQAAESDAAGDVIDRKLKDITGNANEARRSLESVRLAGGVPGRSGVGVGPFGSGFGRVGLLGAGVGAALLTGPAAAPGAAGLLASIPTLAAGGIGALGTLALAFQGVGKAIGGDKKAFDDLGPSAKSFVETVRSLDGWFDKLKQTAGASLFPGLTAGLKSALSPGTVSAITTAVTQMGKALGAAGAQWGRYFGSAQFQQIFGPLMQAGAKNISVLSDAALHLFDALGVLGRAAIPFTSWLVKAADAGSKLADSWLRSKEASGALGRGLSEAEQSLRLVGGLAVALLRAVGSLGQALYPVAKVAVKALTDGLNALAGIIDRNKQTIRDIVGGALAALVSTVRVAVPIIGALVRGLESVARAVGGWKIAFEIVLSGFLAARFVALGKSIGGIGSKIFGIGKVAEGAAGQIGKMSLALSAFARLAAVPIIVHEIIQKTGLGAAVAGPELSAAGDLVPVRRNGVWVDPNTGKPVNAASQKFWNDRAKKGNVEPTQLRGGASSAPQPGTATPYLSFLLTRAQGTKSISDDKSALDRIIATLQGRLRKATTLAAKQALTDTLNIDEQQLQSLTASSSVDLFTSNPPFTKNLGAKTKKPSITLLTDALNTRLSSLGQAAASASGDARIPAQLKLVQAEKDALHYLNEQHATGQRLQQLANARLALAHKIAALEKTIDTERAKALSKLPWTDPRSTAKITGDKFLSASQRIAIASAQITPGHTDDVNALTRARDALEKWTHTVSKALRVPLAEEIGKLSARINGLSSTMDGFNLTIADQMRHSHDARFRDIIHARTRANMTEAPGPAVVYSPTFHSHDEAHQRRTARRDWFTFKNTLAAAL